MQVDHFAFRVNDLDRSIDFYSNVLGLKLMFRQFDPNHHEAFAFFELEGGNLELLQCLDEFNQPVPPVLPAIEPPFTPHLALKAEDLGRIIELLKEKSIPIVKGPLEIPGQVRWLYLADPDHNILEFVQWLN
ncbi:MAG: VOC family protein [Candidatus Omnitrophica bacterium]|nr:VOC family protein [Candidatus Omnitrophota bacterium]